MATKATATASVFETLNAVNCNEHTEKKNGLTYLSWAWAWSEVKKHYPASFYTIYENANGLFYHTDGKTCWVKTGVTIEGIEMIEYLPIMDYRNSSIPQERVTSFDVNKAIQRSLTKACARHGLGLYIYAGEDLPEEEKKAQPQQQAQTPPPAASTKPRITNAIPAGTTQEQYNTMLIELESCTDRQQVSGIWNDYKNFQTYAPWVDAVKKACAKFPKN